MKCTFVKLFLFLFNLVVLSNCLKGQDVINKNYSNINITINKPLNINHPFFCLNIIQEIVIQDFVKDSVIINSPSNVVLKSKKADIKIDKILINGENYLVDILNQRHFALPCDKNKGKTKIKIYYSYIGNVFSIIQMTNNLPKIYYCDSEEEALLFLSNDFEINEITINTGDYLRLFSEYTSYKQKNLYVFKNLNERKLQKFNFFCIDERLYYRDTIESNKSVVCLYLQKGHSMLIDTITGNFVYDIKGYNQDYYQNYKRIIRKAISSLHNFFDNFKNISIIEFVWENKGRCRGNYIVCDSTLFTCNSLTHEILHSIIEVHSAKNDSAKYFIDEALVEYLSVYFYYSDRVKRENCFNQKIIDYSGTISNNYESIFQVHENSKDAWGIIYNRTPFLIHNFAKKIGEEKFIGILKKMYKIGKNDMSLKDFKDFLIENNVQKKEIENFIEEL